MPFGPSIFSHGMNLRTFNLLARHALWAVNLFARHEPEDLQSSRIPWHWGRQSPRIPRLFLMKI